LNFFLQADAPADAAEGTKPSTSMCQALLRGSLGFAGVSVAAFAVWACAGKWLHAHVGEAGLYVACAMVFIVFSGLALHGLARGPGSLVRFYKIFLPAFGCYAVAWSAAWLACGFGLGEWLGCLVGSFVLAVMIGRGLGHFHSVLKVSLVMFALHSAGYFLGEKLFYWLVNSTHGGMRGTPLAALAKLGWGMLYGLGLGAGLGYAFFTFQIEPKGTHKTG
jgi:hypothetical protein